MKRILSLTAGCILLAQIGFGQFYDGFTGTGNIGGDCSDATCSNNGWSTHSNTKPATIDILDGSLSYSGLQTSTGNKVYITGNTMELARDVNAAVTINGNVAYFSALIKIIDNTNLNVTAEDKFNYFMHFGQTAGNAVTSFYTRLGIKSVNAGANFHLGVTNTSSGTFTDFATDLTFGTTYLVVMKYDKTTNTSSLWVNPASLGSDEPAGSVTASNGDPAATIASICIRNGYSTTDAVGTPKAEIDEIRVAESWAGVTPAGTGINNVENYTFNMYPNPTKDYLWIEADNAARIVVLNAIGQQVMTVENVTSKTRIETANLQNGLYFVSVTEGNGNTSVRKFIKK